ncbi:hypothetical protein D3C80_1206860 [compost metagenome]
MMKKSQRQLSHSVRCPPSVGPTVGARVTIRPMMTLAVTRFSGGKAVKATAKTVGIMAPPRKPCSARKKIIISTDDDRPTATLMIRKPTQEARKSFCVPHSRDRYPDRGIITTSGIR